MSKTRSVRGSVSSILTVVGVLLLPAATCRAFDGQREGFCLGMGLGGAVTATREYRSGNEDIAARTYAEQSAATNVSLGYAPTNRVLICFDSRVLFSRVRWLPNQVATYAHALSSVSVCHWIRPTAPSVLLDAGIGIASLSTPFDDPPYNSFLHGIGFHVGAGYEFVRHVTVHVSAGLERPTIETVAIDANGQYIGRLTTVHRELSLRGTLNLLAY